LLTRLFDNEDRESWSKASRAINKDIGNLPECDRNALMRDPDLMEKFETYRDNHEDDRAYADYVLSLDFALHKHTDAEPRTFRLR